MASAKCVDPPIPRRADVFETLSLIVDNKAKLTKQPSSGVVVESLREIKPPRGLDYQSRMLRTKLEEVEDCVAFGEMPTGPIRSYMLCVLLRMSNIGKESVTKMATPEACD